jgi:hypothetical protein
VDPHRGTGRHGVILNALLALALDAVAVVGFSGSPPFPPPFPEVEVTDAAISELSSDLLAWYLSMGYPFASAGMYFSSPDTLMVNLVPGRRASLEGVRFPEGMRTKPGLLLRWLSLEPGDPYDPEAVSRWLDALDRLDFLESTGVPELYLGPMGDIVLNLPVSEASPGWFSGGMSYGEASGVLGGGELVLSNLFGGGRRLELSAQATGFGIDGSFLYREPWLFGTPAGFSVFLSQEIPDSGSVNRRWETLLFYDLGGVEVSGGGGSWSGWPAGGERQRYDYGEVGLTWDFTGRVPQGRKGFVGTLSTTGGTASEPDSDSLSTWFMATGEGSASVTTFSGAFGFGLGIRAGGILQGEWLSSGLWRLGGYGTLRGYPENVFRAGRWGVASPEVSLGETATRLYVFSDIGLLETLDGLSKPVSIGGGLRGGSDRLRYDAGAGFPVDGGPGDARFYLSAIFSI